MWAYRHRGVEAEFATISHCRFSFNVLLVLHVSTIMELFHLVLRQDALCDVLVSRIDSVGFV